MKKFLGTAAALTLFATPAFAQDITGGIDFNLTATVSTVCGVFPAGAAIDNGQDTLSVDFGDLGSTSSTVRGDIGGSNVLSVNYICNSPGGFSRTVSSANDGFLVRTGAGLPANANNRIAYVFDHRGSRGIDVTPGDFAANPGGFTETFNGRPAFLGTGVGGNIRFTADGVQTAGGTTSVFAGDYTDTLTITVVVN